MSGLFRKGTSATLVRSVAFVAIVGVLGSGCGDPPEVKQAQELCTQAEAAIGSKDFDKAVKLATEAEGLNSTQAGKDLLAKAKKLKAEADAAAAAAAAAAAKDKKIKDGLAAMNKALGAKQWAAATAAADGVLAVDAGNAAAKSGKAKAAKGKADDEIAKNQGRAAEMYAAAKKQMEDAAKRRNWGTAIAKAKETDNYKGPGRPSLASRIPGFEVQRDFDKTKGMPDNKAKLDILSRLKDKAKGDREIAAAHQRVWNKVVGETERGKRIAQARNLTASAEKKEKAGDLKGALANLRDAQRLAADDAGLRTRIRQMTVRINTELTYQSAVTAGDRALQQNNFELAIQQYRRAYRIKASAALKTKITKSEASLYTKQAEDALAKKDLPRAERYIAEAIKREPSADRAKLAATIKSAIADTKVGEVVTMAMKAQKVNNLRPYMEKLEKLAAEGNTAAAKLIKTGFTSAEKSKLDKAAAAENNKLKAELPKIKNAADQVKRYEAAMPKVKYTKLEKSVASGLQKAKDAVAMGEYNMIKAMVDKAKPSSQKVSIIKSNISKVAGTKYEGMLKKTQDLEQGKIAMAKYNAFKAKLNVTKPKPLTAAAKEALCRSAMGDQDYKGTRYAAMLQKDLETARSGAAKPDFDKLTKQLNVTKPKPLTTDAKIQLLDGASKNQKFVDTTYMAQIKSMLTNELNTKATKAWQDYTKAVAKAKPQQALDISMAKKAQFAGTRYESMLKKNVDKYNTMILTGKYKDLTTRLKGDKTPALKLARLRTNQATFKGSRYEATVAKLITSNVNQEIVAKYKKLTTDVKKMKDPKKKIDMLKAGEQELKGSRYEKAVKSMLQRELDGLKKNLFTNVMKTLKGKKTAKDKVAYLESQLGEFKGSGFAAQIQKMITTEKGKIAAEAKAAAAAAAKKAKADAEAAAKKAKIAAEAKAGKVYETVMKQVKDKKNAKNFDANIQALKTAKAQVAGTKYVSMIDKEIANQDKAKKAAAPKRK